MPENNLRGCEIWPIGSGHGFGTFAGASVLLESGWEGRPDEQFNQVMDELEAKGKVYGVYRNGPWFHLRDNVILPAQFVAERSLHGKVLMVGGSLGAMLTILQLYAMAGRDTEAFPGMEYIPENVSALIIDPPSGVESLKALEKLPESVGRFIGNRMGHLRPGVWNRGPLNAAFQRALCTGIAADAPIELPAGMDPDSDEAERYRESVRRACFDGQQGYETTALLSELSWMCRDTTPQLMVDACLHVDRRVKVVHVACTHENEVVVHPTAQNFYKEYLPWARFGEFETNHLDIEQFAPSWRTFMRDVLSLF